MRGRPFGKSKLKIRKREKHVVTITDCYLDTGSTPVISTNLNKGLIMKIIIALILFLSGIVYSGSTTVDTTNYRDSAAALSDEVIRHSASNTIGCHEPPSSCHLKWPTAWCDPNAYESEVVSGYKGKVTTENLTWVNDYPWCYYYHCDSGKWYQVGECQPRASGSGIFCHYKCKN